MSLRHLSGALLAACTLMVQVPSANALVEELQIQVPTAIDATGRTDVTAALAGFIGGLPDGVTIVFPAGAKYRIDKTLEVVNRNRLTIEGNGARFFATTTGDRERAHLKIRWGSDIVVRDIVITGANPAAGLGPKAYNRLYEAQHGIGLAGVDGALIENVTVTDTWGDLIYVGSGGIQTGTDASGQPVRTRRLSTDVTIRNSYLARSGRQGIAMSGVDRVLIERNSITDAARSMFDLEPDTVNNPITNVTIRDNQVGPARFAFVANLGAAGAVDRINVSGNQLDRIPLRINFSAPPIARRSNITVSNNVSNLVVNETPIKFTRVDGISVVGNTQRLKGAHGLPAGVRLTQSCNWRIGSNNFSGGSQLLDRGGYRCSGGGGPAAPPSLPSPVAT